MCSDAKITDPDEPRSNPLKGALKLITINDICIGYAGKYPIALDSIRKVRKFKLFQVILHIYGVLIFPLMANISSLPLMTTPPDSPHGLWRMCCIRSTRRRCGEVCGR